MRELGQLRGRVVKLGRAGSGELVQDALAMCDSLLRDLAGAHTECDALRVELQARAAASAAFFESLPVACVVTDSSSTIVTVNAAAALVLNTNVRRLKARELLVYAEDREGFLHLLRRLASEPDGQIQATLRFRPRERKPRELNLLVAPLPGASAGHWLWFLQPTVERTLLGVFDGSQNTGTELTSR